MRFASILSVVLVCAAGAAWANEAPPVRVELGAAAGRMATTTRSGGGAVAGVSVPVTRWLALGVEGAYFRFGAPTDIVSIPEAWPTFDDTRVLTLSAVTLLTLPNAQKVAPFVTLGTGVGALRWGDVHVRDMNLGSYTVRGSTERGLCASMGAGLLARFERPWPQLRVEGRLLQLTGRSGQRLLLPRVVLSY